MFLAVFFNRRARGEASLHSSSSQASSAMLTLVGSRSGQCAFLCRNGRPSSALREFSHARRGSSGGSGGDRSSRSSSSSSIASSRHDGGWAPSVDRPMERNLRERQRRLWRPAPVAAPPYGSMRGPARRPGSSWATTATSSSSTALRASARPPSEEEPATSGVEIVAGTRVRLRDTGRLGTVVGKKAGGWWKVDLLDSWNGGGGAELVDGAAAAAAAAGTDVASTAGSGPVSTRRVNMEPLGNAYASSSSSSEGSGAVAVAAPPSAGVAGKRGRAASTAVSSSRRGAATVATATGSTSAAAVPAARRKTAAKKGSASRKRQAADATLSAVAPPSLLAQTISLEVPATAAAEAAAEAAAVVPEGGTETVAIGKMSAEGLAHAAMKEWLVFSDLHVSPGSLAVTLEVCGRMSRCM